MTHFNRNSISRSALATLLLAIAPFTFGADRPVAAGSEVKMMGHIVVTAPKRPAVIRSIVQLGEMTVTANRSVQLADLGSMTVTASRNVTLADLGGMTVTASRDVTLADLGGMTVTANRDVVLASTAAPRANQTSL